MRTTLNIEEEAISAEVFQGLHENRAYREIASLFTEMTFSWGSS